MPVPTPGSAVFNQSRDLVYPPSNSSGTVAAMHARIFPNNSASDSLADWMVAAGYTGGIPLRTTNPPCAVTFQIESGATGKAWVALNEAAAATNGLEIPRAPAIIRIPGREFLRNDLVNLIGDQAEGPAVQVFYEWLAENA